MDNCTHPNFKIEADVCKLEDEPGIYKTDIRIWCSVCFKPLIFIGMPAGVHPEKPTVSIDQMEVRLTAKLIS